MQQLTFKLLQVWHHNQSHPLVQTLMDSMQQCIEVLIKAKGLSTEYQGMYFENKYMYILF
jgi:hypothetical protein